MKHVPIIPLAGGLSMGVDKAFGSTPDNVLSYEDFEYNDRHYINYLKKQGKDPNYQFIDSDTNSLDSTQFPEADVITALPPCAGLSMVNRSESRGSESKTNDWMYKSTEFALENLQPEVLMGENAPNLFTETGLGVQKNLYKIARKYGYSLSLIKTDNYFHGVPQHRMRTLFFFWKGDKVPVYPWNNDKSDTKHLADYLDEIPGNAIYQNVEEKRKDFEENIYVKYGKHKWGDGLRDFMRDNYKNKKLLDAIRYEGLMDEAHKWLKENTSTEKEKKLVKRLKYKIEKLKDGKGYWDSYSPAYFFDATNAIMHKNTDRIVHPRKDRFLTLREEMHLMGLPHDYELVNIENKNVICQNVILNTGEHFANFIIDAINGDVDYAPTTMLKQHNVSEKFCDTADIIVKDKELF